jgi:predicted dehydrogenase
MKRLKAGIIGLGVGESHIAGYCKHPQCDVVALCDFSEEKLAYAHRKYPNMRLYERDEDLIDDPEVQVVSVATFDNCHYRQIVRAIEQGKHVFVEKPLVLFEQELRHIRTLLNKKAGVKISSNLILRRSPRFLQLRQMIQQKKLGELYHLEGDYNYGRIQKILAGWRGKLDFYSVFLGGAVHMVDLLMWLSGRKITKVAAFGTNIATRGTDFQFNDMVVTVLTFDNGMTGKIAANFACVYPHFHKLSVYGTKGTFENGLEAAQLFHSRDKTISPERIDTAYSVAAKGDLIESFVGSILSEAPAEVTTDDVFESMSVCLAVEKSMVNCEITEVEYI